MPLDRFSSSLNDTAQFLPQIQRGGNTLRAVQLTWVIILFKFIIVNYNIHNLENIERLRMGTTLEHLYFSNTLAATCILVLSNNKFCSIVLQFKLKTDQFTRAKEQLCQIHEAFQIEIQRLKLMCPNTKEC